MTNLIELRNGLPIGSVVHSAHFGVGRTTGSVTNNSSRLDRAFVPVEFDADWLATVSWENHPRVAFRRDPETGEESKYYYRNILLTHLEQEKEILGKSIRSDVLIDDSVLDEEDSEDDTAYAQFLQEEFEGE